MKTLKIKKRIEKYWVDLTPKYGCWKKREHTDFIVRFDEDEYIQYINWKYTETRSKCDAEQIQLYCDVDDKVTSDCIREYNEKHSGRYPCKEEDCEE